jgi:2-polyprenyl-3-methyl-5-hydroxy-6-metoxy-1,4-benzoquinol methylase
VSAFPNLARRNRQPEVMEEPSLERARHFLALRGLGRINTWSGSAGILWPPIRSLFEELDTRRLRLLDIASGGGDIAVKLWRRAQSAGFNLEIQGYDVSGAAISYAASLASQAGAPIPFTQYDVLSNDPLPACDVVTCSLFLHHLADEDAVLLLNRMATAARHRVLVNDLRRGYGGYFLALAGTRLLSRSDVVHVDGPRSVQGAFSQAEVENIAQRAGLTGATVARRWPCRFLLTWNRPL